VTRTLLSIAVVISLMPTAALAETSDLVIADLGLHVVGVGLEHRATSHTAVSASIDLYAPWTQMGNDDRGANDVLGAVLRVRPVFYVQGGGAGLWVSPFVQGGLGWGLVDGERHRGTVYAIGAAIGYAWMVGPVMLSAGVGAQYHHASFDVPGKDTPSFAGVWPHVDLVAGYTL